MAITRQWLETKPAVTDKIKDGPAEFQARWKDLRELFNSAGIVCDGTSPLAEQGRQAVLASGIASPDIYESDQVTSILAWADAGATLQADYPITGDNNIVAATLGDGCVSADAKGYVRALDPLRISESDPVDPDVNVSAGVYWQTGSAAIGYYAGGSLTLGVGDLALPAAGNHAHFLIYLTGAGVLSALSGAEVAMPGALTSPDIPLGATPIAIILIQWNSVNFSLATSGNNAYLIREQRGIVSPRSDAIKQVGQTTSGTFSEQSNVIASKAITTTGGIIIAAGTAQDSSTLARSLSIGRSGFPIGVGCMRPTILDCIGTVIGIETRPAGGPYTYELRCSVSGVSGASIWLMEIQPTAFF